MFPISFDESDTIISNDQSATAALVIYDEEHNKSVVTCWKLTKEELEEINSTGRCYLVIEGTHIPTCYISVMKPFEKVEGANDHTRPSDN